MSHYVVAVISKKYVGKEVNSLLAKYDEDKREVFKDCTKEVLDAWKTGKTEYDSEIDKSKYSSIEEFADSYFGYETISCGDYKEYGYYFNPDAKWDWYSIGGRWNELLKLKNSTKGVNFGQVKDLDFNIDINEYKRCKRFWELYIEDQEPQNEEERKIKASGFYKKEYYIKRYKNKETYAKLTSEFSTFAVLTDKGWFEKGEMGWFGCSSESHEESYDWDVSYYDRFIKDLDPETYITIVDCHI